MKRFLLLAVAALAFVGCNEMFEDEGNSSLALSELPTLTAGFEDADTRTYVESNKYLRWHESDLISVFVGNTQNCQYRFLGATGANSGEFEPVESDNLGTGNALDRIYAVYPYDAETTISDLGVISYSMPATQTYAEASFGRGANVMVAATESLDDRFLGFKNTCGYLKIKLHGGGVVTSIKLKGNNGEKIAGNATITATYGGVPEIVMLDDATDSIILDCGDGVELSTDAENPTEFWIVVPPIEFSKGITIVAYSDKTDYEFTKSTDSPITIERNVVQPMKSLRAEFLGHTGNDHNPSQIPNDEIWYTSTDGNIVEPYVTDVFGANIVSNAYDDGKGVIKFDGDVTTIGKQAFLDCTRLESIIIPNKVTTIGEKAFYGCSGLTTVTIPDTVTKIGWSAFCDCFSLTSITIPNSVTKIERNTFYNCTNLTDVTIGDSVTNIENYAFYDCTNLTNITIPESLTTIDHLAFNGCENIKSIYITDLTAWCNLKGAFYPCEGGDIYLNGDPLTHLVIPDEITEIRASAFRNCSSLTSVTIPDSVTKIGDYAFYGCSSLTSVIIGDSVTTIGKYAFGYCSSLTSVTIQDSVTTIGNGVFYGCSSLTSVIIGDSVTTIGGSAFYGCESLTNITIGDSVTTIGGSAFYGCDSLTNITIGDSVTTIGYKAFYGCDSLTSITIPNSVTTIDSNAFDNCENLKSIYITDLTAWCNIEFGKWGGLYPCEGGDIYLNGDPLTHLVIPDDITEIRAAAFCNCSSLTSVTIHDSVTTIGGSAFRGCTNLISVIIGNSVTTIGSSAFSGCSSLTDVTIGEGITTIGDYAFDYCKNLKNVHIKDLAGWCNVEMYNYQSNPLRGCDFLYVNDEVITHLVIPNGVTKIGDYAFYLCNSFKNITIPDSVTTIGRSAFSGCNSLTSVTIPDSVTEIGRLSFAFCDRLSTMTIGKNVSKIGGEAFGHNYCLYKIYCKPTTPPELESALGISSLAYDFKIYVPSTSVDAYRSAKNWSEFSSHIHDGDF